jgi:hypothetical protein
MTSAQENDDGFIECKPFIQAAPEIVQALRKRRMAYRARGLPGVEIPLDAVKHCFSEEAHVTANQLTKIFEQMTQEDSTIGRWSEGTAERSATKGSHNRGSKGSPGLALKSGAGNAIEDASEERMLVGIKRRFCQDCVTSLPERLSPQEAMRLLQMLPEDEDGFIRVDELAENLEHLRTEAMLNALVESDVLSLRTHLVLRFRHLGLEENGKMRVWVIKQALLQADQVCLTRLQIHVLLCLAEYDAFGLVDIAKFLCMCCAIIPHMFDARLFVETAGHLIQEHAESLRRAENEELAALGAARNTKTAQDDEGSQQKVEVDSDTVEKMLLQVLSLNDDTHRTPPSLTAETIFNILQTNEREVQCTQLSTFELTGFLAEMQSDVDGQVAYVDHVKKWVPLIFEQRKNRLLGRYLEEEALETLGIELPDIEKLEAMFPLLPPGSHPGRPKDGLRRSRRREGSLDGSRAGSDSSLPNSKRRERRASTIAGHSGDTPVNSKDRQLLQGSASKTPSGGKRKSLSLHGIENLVPKAKEPPPGRGYARRKALLAAAEAQAAVMPSPSS